MIYLAIDPGDVHVGAAQFSDTVDDWWRPIGWWETDPLAIRDHLWQHGSQYELVVVETFELFKGRAMEQVGSKMRTARLIGAIEAIVVDHWGNEMIEQRPLIQEPTAAQIEARRLFMPERVGRHERSALLHGWHYALTQGSGFPAAATTERTNP